MAESIKFGQAEDSGMVSRFVGRGDQFSTYINPPEIGADPSQILVYVRKVNSSQEVENMIEEKKP